MDKEAQTECVGELHPSIPSPFELSTGAIRAEHALVSESTVAAGVPAEAEAIASLQSKLEASKSSILDKDYEIEALRQALAAMISDVEQVSDIAARQHHEV